MRLFEFIQINEFTDPVAGNIPPKYDIDPATGLALNLPTQWTQSPYLYAVKNTKGPGYSAQIHIPQDFYEKYINGADTSRWRNLPDSVFEPSGQNRTSIRVRFDDPRQAAWFGQQVKYGTEHTENDYLLDYFDYTYGNGDGQLLKDLKSGVPTFSGPPMNSSDEADFYDNKAEREKERQARKTEYDKAQTQKKNTSELGGGFDARMIKIIKKAWNDFYQGHGLAAAQKKFGKKLLTLNQIDSILDKEIEQRGVQYFMTGPKSVNPKKPSEVQL